MIQPSSEGSAEVSITATVEGFDNAKTLAEAALLLRYYATTYGDDEAVRIANEAETALKQISIDIQG